MQAISPAIVMQSLMNTLASTSDERYATFLVQARAFHKVWCDFFEPLIFQRKAFTNYTQIPTFAYQEERESDVAMRTLQHLLMLLVPTVALFVWSISRFKTYSLIEET
jgi:hypothetical protein